MELVVEDDGAVVVVDPPDSSIQLKFHPPLLAYTLIVCEPEEREILLDTVLHTSQLPVAGISTVVSKAPLLLLT